MAIETDDTGFDEEEIRQRVHKERDAEAERIAREKELEEESVQLEKELEEEIRGTFATSLFEQHILINPLSELTEDERASILAEPEFQDFLERSSKVLQRALNDQYDYIRDYTIGAESGGYVFPLNARLSLTSP